MAKQDENKLAAEIVSVLDPAALRACSPERDVIRYAVRGNSLKLRSIVFDRAALRRLLGESDGEVKVDYLKRDLVRAIMSRVEYRYPRTSVARQPEDDQSEACCGCSETIARVKHERALAYAAFAVVCIVWGTTYLAIRVAVRTIPPMLLTSARFVVAGLILFALALLRRERIPRAFAELARNRSADHLRALSDAASALARGELVQREDAWKVVSVARYLERCRLKTASLFEASCRLGALTGARPDDHRAPRLASELGHFGRRIGMAFQILDDVLDVEGPPERTGKARGADLMDGTVNLPLILARRRDPELAALDVRALREPEVAEEACRRIAATGVLEEARERALRLVSGAKAELPGALSAGQREVLELVADAVVERFA